MDQEVWDDLTSRFFLDQTLTTPDFYEIGSEIFAKMTFDDKNRQN